MTRLYIIIAIFSVLGGAWGLSMRLAYNRGHDAAVTAQKLANAENFRSIIEEYNDATDNPISDGAADCILRNLTGVGDGEDCGDL